MSVEKVNKYKEDKKNRKEIIAKQKRDKKIGSLIGWGIGLVLVAALVVMIGLTAKNAYHNYKASQPNYDRDYYTVTDMAGILTELDTEEEAVTETEAAPETAETEVSETTDAE